MTNVADGVGLDIKINIWDINAAKHGLDDAIKELMKKRYDMTESFRLFDNRLLLCTLAVGVALIAVIYDYFYPYPLSKYILVACVASYFIITSILSWYTYFVEGNIFFVGLKPDKTGLDPADKWTLSSVVKKHNPLYTLSITRMDGRSGTKSTIEASKTVENFFDKKGSLCVTALEKFLFQSCDDITTKKKD